MEQLLQSQPSDSESSSEDESREDDRSNMIIDDYGEVWFVERCDIFHDVNETNVEDLERPTLAFENDDTRSKPTVRGPDHRERPSLSKKEQKALDRELPWRQLMRLPPSERQAYVDAVHKEADAWDLWGPVRPLSHEEARQVLQDKILKKRILRSRMCYRDKLCGRGPGVLAKARLVVTGFTDPDLHRLTRNSPTATRVAFYVVLQYAASGFMTGWNLQTSDVATAFLQGQQQDRDLPLFMRAPTDPLVEKSGRFHDAQIYLVLGNIYGLANAPYLWSLEVRRRMAELGFVSHSLDVMCFTHRDPKGIIDAICIFHVDDVLISHAPSYDMRQLKAAFTWGPWCSVLDGTIKFIGKQIRLRNHTELIVFQQEFIVSTPVRKVLAGPASNRQLDTGPEYSEYRSCGGSLQWVSGSCRPDTAAATSLLQRGQPELADLAAMYGQLEYLHATSDSGICIRPLCLEKAIVVAYGDSSWANAPGHRTQSALLVVVTEEEALRSPTPASIADWKSSRTTRVVRSTLAGEAVAADGATDHGVYVAKFLAELILDQPAKNRDTVLPLYTVTDAKSLWDAVQQQTPSLTEKRTIIDVASIKQSIGDCAGRFLWVPTTHMMADGLTKIDKKLRDTLRAFMMKPVICLREVKEAVVCIISTEQQYKFC